MRPNCATELPQTMILPAWYRIDALFLRPWWLIAVAGLAICVAWTRRRSLPHNAWRRAIDPHLLAAMAARGGFARGDGGRPVAALVVSGLLILGLAGPARLRPDADGLRNLDALTIVADLSRRDATEAEMTQLRFLLRRLADAGATRQTGLIVYAGDAYVASARSDDPDIAAAAIAALEADTVPDPGARPELGLGLALENLQGTGAERVADADIVLVSGGAGASEPAAQAAAAALKASGYRLHAVAVAGEPDGALERRAALAAMAAAGGGIMVEAGRSETLIASLAEQPVLHWRRGALAGLAWQDLGRALLAAAALASLALFRRQAA